jgi:DNA-binding HxlR family transcriptional regulator
MPTRRSYADACPIARALDAIGERWALLVVRELLLGPQRFSDLRGALPGASTNILTDRLRELGDHGVVHRYQLPPPAGSAVYGLTTRGSALFPALDALGQWGSQLPLPAGEPALSATSVLLFFRGCLRRHHDPPRGVYRIQLDDRIWTIRTTATEPAVEPGDPDSAVAGLRTDPDTLNSLLADPAGLDAATASLAVHTSGNLASLRRLLRVAREVGSTAPSGTT